MKSFKEIALQEVKDTPNVSFESESFNAITAINKLIEYGRDLDIDNKSINPLLDAIKNIHIVGDSIRRAELSSTINDSDDKTW